MILVAMRLATNCTARADGLYREVRRGSSCRRAYAIARRAL